MIAQLVEYADNGEKKVVNHNLDEVWYPRFIHCENVPCNYEVTGYVWTSFDEALKWCKYCLRKWKDHIKIENKGNIAYFYYDDKHFMSLIGALLLHKYTNGDFDF
ncbi:MAG: hypothetical protein [Wendovervirus sonii]|uniref:Uncharacterized protein n=1 Tax=phage Lak_Megaphage_Sonny TaxID=3109229 RepID=A0ABZ0Z3X6_9CAUD|nr:MAG: hypothetical protein [phage Lak_Megaphage_Sonny]